MLARQSWRAQDLNFMQRHPGTPLVAADMLVNTGAKCLTLALWGARLTPQVVWGLRVTVVPVKTSAHQYSEANAGILRVRVSI